MNHEISVKKRVAVLISGRGSNLAALIEACHKPDFPATIVRVISSRNDALGLGKAQKAGIANCVISMADYQDKTAFEVALNRRLVDDEIDIICLAGFTLILSPHFVSKWHNRIINIHPSLLPSFKGLNGQAQALNAGVMITGCSVHFVQSEIDSGPIIAQAAVSVAQGDDVASLSKRILTAEHIIYPLALKLLAASSLEIRAGMVNRKTAETTPEMLICPNIA